MKTLASTGDEAEKCPVDPKTRELWLQAAKAKSERNAGQAKDQQGTRALQEPRFSLDTMTWQIPTTATPATPRAKKQRLPTDREISTIPRALPPTHRPTSYNHAESAASHGAQSSSPYNQPPANSEKDTGHDSASGNWIYPSQEMFFAAMQRKGHSASASDMASIVPIHNAVNERAWSEIKAWEAGRGSEACGGPKLVSFSGDSKALTPRARWNVLMGYQMPFDRHDWVVDRCGKRIDYVIDFYSGKDSGVAGRALNFYLDVRPKLNTWEGTKTRMMRAFGA
ncbi:hypothetical protein BAUCODRAFT_68383 [Baudoinia panamericana UAMH 10762]|uniref:Holocytochrome c-type synthase n=1 Tax=Baudoinia panamericana (strain UAMH 10762) TaxID=717646 RepID=M2MLY5_BAUPA|nr:uncharacterized protein BAUCODRAFT_68383 [Baudoinia panamericana UAMH 10762]EMC97686.1 hypothetical protein BAUCODRAFT_68383 [Baudoinia panamericana UAMH 10762]